jgi:methylphosphotriester-DNA--protein-cysteine methyltransferase
MIRHIEISDSNLLAKIRHNLICFGGNYKLKIYGTLSCTSGKRMKRKNRVFFLTEIEAIETGYRPCGKCMYDKYKNWRNETV